MKIRHDYCKLFYISIHKNFIMKNFDKFLKISVNTFFICISIFILSSSISFKEKITENNCDCSEAMRICYLSDYYFPEMNGMGIYENLDVNNSMIKETNSLWLKFEVEVSGVMEFLIVPDKKNDDIDFILYEAINCGDKKPIRVMTTGETFGSNIEENCIGQTGLQRISSDIIETDGCFDLDDNFLKPVFLEKGKNYFLLINNYNSSSGFNILFSGENGLKLKNSCEEIINEKLEMGIYPNPASELLNIYLNKKIDIPSTIQIFDLSGKVLYTSEKNKIEKSIGIDISGLPSGKVTTQEVPYFSNVLSSQHKCWDKLGNPNINVGTPKHMQFHIITPDFIRSYHNFAPLELLPE